MSQPAGLVCLSMMAQFYQVAIDITQLRREYCQNEKQDLSLPDLVRAAKKVGLKSDKLTLSSKKTLTQLPLPAIIEIDDGGFAILAKYDSERDCFLVQFPDQKAPAQLTHQEVETRCTGNVVLITKRTLLPGMSGKFDISWFVPAIIKHKRILGQVLLASFFIQLFALITPLFFSSDYRQGAGTSGLNHA
jgi:subfamily B ATP-binding cassette protein HlyB/CyaB